MFTTLRAKKYPCAIVCALALYVFFSATATAQQKQQEYMNLDSVCLDLDLVEIEGVQTSGKGSLTTIASLEVEKLDRSPESSRILALRKELGVDLVTSGGGAVQPVIRGLSGLRVATLYRGATIESQSWGASHGIYIPEQGVSRVDIIRGPNALAISPDAIGGAINFLAEPTLSYIGRENTITMRGFSATDGVMTSFKTKKKSEHSYHTFSGGYNAFQDYLKPDGAIVENSGYNQFFGQGQFGYMYDWGVIDGAYASSYNNAGIIGDEGWQQSGDHLITVSSSYNMGSINLNHVLSYQLNHRKEFEEAEAVGGENGDPAHLDMSVRTTRYSVIAKPKYENSTPYSWRAGSQGKLVSNSNGEDAIEIFIEDASLQELGAFISPSYTDEKLSLLSTLRADHRRVEWTDSREFNFLSYSLGGKYLLSEKAWLLASYSNASRAPSFAELFASGVHHGAFRYEQGNPNLKEESSSNIELGVSFRTDKFQIETNAYHNKISDFIHIRNTGVQVEGFDSFEFYATDALLIGAELGANYKASDALNLNLMASYVEGTDVILDSALPLIPPFTINAIAEYNESKLFVSANAEWTQAFTLLHLSSEYKVNKKMKLGLSVHNAFNTEYIPVLSLLGNLNIPEPGRNISARIAYVF